MNEGTKPLGTIEERLLEKAGEIREAIKTENEARDRNIDHNRRAVRNTRLVAAFVFVVALFGIGVGANGVSDAHDARHAARHARVEADAASAAALRASRALARSEKRTAEARLASCLQFNVQQQQARDGQKREIRSLLSLALAAVPTPDPARTKQFLDAVLPGYDKTVDSSFPDRDCSPQGIADYLKPTSAAP